VCYKKIKFEENKMGKESKKFENNFEQKLSDLQKSAKKFY
jgi:hypothetical protein